VYLAVIFVLQIAFLVYQILNKWSLLAIFTGMSILLNGFLFVYYKKKKNHPEIVIVALLSLIYVIAAIYTNEYLKMGPAPPDDEIEIEMRMEREPEDFRLNAFYRGYLLCFLQVVSIQFISNFYFVFMFDVGTLFLRCFLLKPFDFTNDFTFFFIFHILFDLAALYFVLMNEVQSRKMFVQAYTHKEEFYSQKKEFSRLKSLSATSLSDSIIILDAPLSRSLFISTGFQNRFQTSEDVEVDFKQCLSQIILMKETVDTSKASVSSISSLDKSSALYYSSGINLLKFLQEGIRLNLFKDEASVTYGALSQMGSTRSMKNTKSFEIKISTLMWDGEKALSVVLHEITSRETNIALLMSDANKNKLIASVSHELKTPLNGIQGMIRIMEQQTIDQDMLEPLSMCKNNADLLLHHINSLIDLQLLHEHQFKLYKSKVEIRQVVAQAGRLFVFQCEHKRIGLKLVIEEDVPEYMVTDEERLTQVLVHLITNAVKFTFRGEITIGVGRDPLDARSIVFWVQDTGIGIQDDERKSLFKLFSRPESESVGTKGVGLGLTIARQLLMKLKGTKENNVIEVDSTLEKGSQFKFSLAIGTIEVEKAEETGGDIGQEFSSEAGVTTTIKEKISMGGEALEKQEVSIRDLSEFMDEIGEQKGGNNEGANEMDEKSDGTFWSHSGSPSDIQSQMNKYATKQKDNTYRLMESPTLSKNAFMLDESPSLKSNRPDYPSYLNLNCSSKTNISPEKGSRNKLKDEDSPEDRYFFMSDRSTTKLKKSSDVCELMLFPKENLENSIWSKEPPSATSTVSNPIDLDKFERKAMKKRSYFLQEKRKPSENIPSILLVDDNSFNLMVAKHMIEERGFNVVTAMNGEEAIEKVKENCTNGKTPFKLIFMDLQMPVMDGFESTSILIGMMERNEIPLMPIIALTANNREEDIGKCLKYGMTDHIAKPLKPERLQSVLDLVNN